MIFNTTSLSVSQYCPLVLVSFRIAILVGCFTLILGYSVTFFTLKSVFPLLIISMGICHGIGFCLVYATAVGVAQQWFPPKIRGEKSWK